MGKGGRCVGLTALPPSCAVVMKSVNLNFLEPSGPLQACNGAALPLPFYIHGSVHRESNLLTVQHDATYSVYYISVVSSTCFGC